ncbi:MAG: phosphoglycerate kinase [Actinobacteria bacterium]|nr:phosphoglycerate kinase [Actinomycetota bacterium]
MVAGSRLALDEVAGAGGAGLALDELAGAAVLARLDLNVPLAGRAIADDARVRAALPTLRRLLAGENRVLAVAHLGRPAGAEPRLSLAPVAAALARLLGTDVPLVRDRDERPPRGARVALLENVRFDARETSAWGAERRALADELRAGADLVVSDAFGSLHRPHASIAELVEAGPATAGALVATELELLAPLRAPPAPLVVVVGGTRAREKLPLLERLAAAGATLLLGAQIAEGVARAAAEPDGERARRVLAHERTLLPPDLLVDDAGRLRVVALADLRPDMRAIDLGPRACARFGGRIRAAGTVVWNGPPGFQHAPAGRRGAEALAVACADASGPTIVGGGTTSMPLRALRLADRVTHVSTGGTVLLHLLAGDPLPGLDALRSARRAPAPAPAR